MKATPERFKTADLCDAHGDAVQIVDVPLRSFGDRRAFHGQVVTVRAPEDNSMVRTLLEERGAGRVLVVDGGASRRCAYLGDLLGALAVRQGWAGVVVHGAVRDSAELAKMPLGVLALGTIPRKSEKRGLGERNVPVELGGVTIRTGDWLYADEDGVVISRERL